MMCDPSPELPDDTLIADLRLPTRIRNALVGSGVRTMGGVREMPDATLLSFQGLGTESVSYIREMFGLPSSQGVRPNSKRGTDPQHLAPAKRTPDSASHTGRQAVDRQPLCARVL